MALITLAFCLACDAAVAQQASWQQSMEEDRRRAASGRVTSLLVRAGSELAAHWPPGVYAFYNNPRPFCYAYVIPGEWYLGDGNAVRSKDGRALAGVTFWPPATLDGVEGATLVERAGKVSIGNHEKILRQRLVDTQLVPFESARPGTYLLKAAPLTAPDGRRIPFFLNIIVELGTNMFAEVNAIGTGDDENLARRIIETLKSTSDPACYQAELERMHKATAGAQAGVEYLKEDPPLGKLPLGAIVYVDDGSCPAGEVKELTSGDRRKAIARTTRCVTKPAPGRP